MAQNLGYIKTELERVRREAAATEAQMRALERAVKDVIIAGAKGSGASSLTPQGVGVSNVAAQALKRPDLSPAGRPVGGRAVVGSGVDTAKIQELAAEYAKLVPALSQHNIQVDLLTAAEQKMVIATERATEKLNFEASLRDATAKAEIKIAKARKEREEEEAAMAADAQAASDASVHAWKEESAATEEVTKATKVAGKTLGASTDATEESIRAEQELTDAKKKAAAALGDVDAPYSQASLESIFAKQPGTAKEVSRVAGLSDFKPEDIKKEGITEFAGAFTQLKYEVEGANGVMRKLILTTDKAGNVFTSTQKQFRTFFGAIRRNVTEMLKWSAATLIVWGAIRKLGELLEIAIENETQLASIAVILGEEHANLTDVFNSAAEAAAATGESIDGVLEGYVQAYRATGNITDETERAAQAQALLTDALTLSKLSALTTAQSMDVLTGALRQAGLGFDEGTILIDKWVAVSRAANVGIETLAESFAITATSASNAGLSWDELNGVIATLAESTTLSATESGNAIRAFISGFNTDTAVKELTKYGIAVTDSTGETRGFLDVMKEIAALFSAGIITESELNKISRAIGGGARREAQVATTIKNLGRAQEVAAVSAQADGDAQAALAVQLDTVQTAITRLANSFQKLARAMGSEGGVLDAAGMILDIFTKLVDATASLVSNIGDMTPVLAAMGGLFAATTAQSRGLFGVNIAAGVGGLLDKVTGAKALATEVTTLGGYGEAVEGFVGGGAAGTTGKGTLGTRFAQKLTGPGFGRNAGSLLGQGLGAGYAAYQTGKDVVEGDYAGAASSAVGAIIGGLISGGSPVGIVIGSAAGEAFANATFSYKTEFSDFFRSVLDDATDDEDADGEPREPEGDVAVQKALFEEFGIGNEQIGKFFSKAIATAINTGLSGEQVIGNVTGGLAIGDYQFKAGLPSRDINESEVALGLSARMGFGSAEDVYKFQEEQVAARGLEAGLKPSGEEYASVVEQAALLDEYGADLAAIEKEQLEIFRAGARAGEVTGKEFKDAQEQINALQAGLTAYEVAFGDALRSVDDEISNVADSFDFWTDVLIHGTTEQISELNTYKDQIVTIANAIELAQERGLDEVRLGYDDPVTKDIDEREVLSIAEAEAKKAGVEQEAVLVGQAQMRAINRERIVLPTVLDLDISEADIPKLQAEMDKIRTETFEGFWAEGLATDWSAAEIAETFAPFFVSLGQNGAGKYFEGFERGMASEAFENLVRRGEIKPTVEDKKIGLKELDISSAELPGVMAEYDRRVASIQGQLGAQGIEWSPDEETFGALLNDNVAIPITADLTLLNIAMQELIEVSKDQLDGIYNLPTDASFYVPWSAALLAFTNSGGVAAAPAAEAGIPEVDEVREPSVRGRPEGYVPRSIRGRLARARRGAVKGVGAETERDPFDYPSEGERFKGITPATYGYETPPNIQLPGIQELLKIVNKLGTPMGGAQLAAGSIMKYFDDFGSKDALIPEKGSFDLQTVPEGSFMEGFMNNMRDLFGGLFGLDGDEPTLTTKLQIESTTNTIVQLDGQVIANAIKPYLLNDEVRYEGTAGSAVKRFVIQERNNARLVIRRTPHFCTRIRS